MEAGRRSSLAFGLVLILLGLWFFAAELSPGLREWLGVSTAWPLFIVAFGLLFLLIGILTGAPGMAVPACIFVGIGALLYWQNLTGNWGSWAYAWALIPGFVGIGVILMGLLGHDTRRSLAGGAWLIVISAIVFAISSTFLGGPNLFGAYWPALLILLGVILLGRSLFAYR